ncbi:Dabb family protein [Pararobbsia silviterrae]|uniref:Dabb family protein n=2 Tax=Pararobbsia silviterrae TaxID=1792498 RepID=A0A494XZB8_9BURK|nr:Dabb family protein [Pararobbsia silviterrae]RKP53514.1 Dabb family protein [Pararobbsia silviterrae]
MPIRHIVLCQFRPDVPVSAQQDLIDKIEALGKIDGIRFEHFSSGRNVSEEGRSNGFESGFSMDFADAGALTAYLVHPEHQKLGAALVALLESGIDSLCVFDMDIGVHG